ncbi:hypothetical protein HC752_23850 [Vibrio sp. S9_S30]|uniref:hypothetical protein n=1 Tax=Vibrio sp. S9_S30 TaxID=2720226 RepID=UPI001681ABCE|nr:hypothetical protein [Vibrio sp. S9_S30]MBD1559957.1 hypothetical protein [Vibrio sp. S9_S30]
MKKLFWWNLSTQEKASRSFILTPIIGILVFLALQDSSLSGFQVSGIILGSMALMVLQGLYYRRKDSNNGDIK